MAKALKDKGRPSGVGQGCSLWVVEMLIDASGVTKWVPTIGVALIRADADLVLREWRTRNPDDSFRLRRYWRAVVVDGGRE